MDFINKGYTQLADLFRSMTPGARITAGLLLTMVVLSLAFLVNNSSSGGGTYLLGGEPFTATQLPAMQAAFSKANLHDAVIDGNRIKVPFGKESAYLAALGDAGVLPSFGSALEKAVASNPWTPKDQRRDAMRIGVQQNLQLIISQMRGIESAAVMIDSAEAKSFGGQPTVTASVSVQPKMGTQLDENQVRAVRNLVASAVVNLKPDNVTVTDLLAGRTYHVGENGGGGGIDNPYASLKRAYEKEWSDKIASSLSYIPGVLVNCNVELMNELMHEESSTDYDPKTVSYREEKTESTKSMRGGAASTGGRPGFAANQHGANQSATVGGGTASENTDENTHKKIEQAISSKSKHTKQVPMTPNPQHITAQIGIPSSYYEKIWTERNPPADGQPAKKPEQAALDEIASNVRKDVEKAVNALLPPLPAVQDPFPRVNVASFPSLPGQPLSSPALAEKVMAWTGQYWSTLGTLGLGLFSLVMLRSMVRALPTPASTGPATENAGVGSFNVVSTPEEGANGVAATAAVTVGGEAPDTSNTRNRLKRRTSAGLSLRDELSQVVKEDPDAAVSVLRAWIGKAS